jgi:hypothetical protein
VLWTMHHMRMFGLQRDQGNYLSWLTEVTTTESNVCGPRGGEICIYSVTCLTEGNEANNSMQGYVATGESALEVSRRQLVSGSRTSSVVS